MVVGGVGVAAVAAVAAYYGESGFVESVGEGGNLSKSSVDGLTKQSPAGFENFSMISLFRHVFFLFALALYDYMTVIYNSVLAKTMEYEPTHTVDHSVLLG